MSPDEIEKLPYRPCVGIMLCNARGGVFTGRRLDNNADAWQMPQGGIEADEDPQTAALRELEEETGIPKSAVEVVAQSGDWINYDLPHNLVPKLWKGRFRGQKQIWFLMLFTGDDSLVNIQTEHPEFSHWQWMQPSDLLDSIVPFKRETYAQVIREFKDQIA